MLCHGASFAVHTLTPLPPFSLQSPGKLVRQLVQDGEHVVEGQPFAEIEVMKMIQTILSPASGIIHFQVGHQKLPALAFKTAGGV